MVQKPTPPMDDEEAPPAESGAETPAPNPEKFPARLFRKIKDRIVTFNDKVAAFIWSREFRIVPTTMTIIGVLILMALGTWQLIRHQEKNIAIATIKESLAKPITDMSNKFPRDDATWKKYAFHQVLVKGTWLPLHQFKLIPRTFEEQVGYHLIVPLKLSDNQIIFVNRGFVPDSARILPPPEEKVFAVQGILRVPESHKSWATPENLPSRRVWTWADLAAMRHEIGVNSAVPVLLYEARNEGQESYPIGGQIPVPTHNRHKQYAMTWFALAIALIGVWMIASNPKEKLKPVEDNAAANDDERLNDPVARRGLYPEATD